MGRYKAEAGYSFLNIPHELFALVVNAGLLECTSTPEGGSCLKPFDPDLAIFPHRSKEDFKRKLYHLVAMLEWSGGALTMSEIKKRLWGSACERHAVINELVRGGVVRVHQQELPPGEKRKGRPPTLVSLRKDNPHAKLYLAMGPFSGPEGRVNLSSIITPRDPCGLNISECL